MMQNIPTDPIIRLSGVTKTYRKGDLEIKPLDGVAIEIAQGDFVAIMGPSGSGKSTLLNMIAGIDKPTSGRVTVTGVDITDFSEDELASWRSRAVGYVFQQYNLMPVLTAWENIELQLLLFPLPESRRRAAIEAALDIVGLSDRASHFPRQLSGGQEQRVAIARAIACDPQIILADEPTGSLDRDSAESLMNLLVELNQSLGKTIVVVTHDPHVACRAKRVVNLDKGLLSESGMETAGARGPAGG